VQGSWHKCSEDHWHWVDKPQKKAVGTDVEIPSDNSIRKKVHKKLENYQGLKLKRCGN